MYPFYIAVASHKYSRLLAYLKKSKHLPVKTCEADGYVVAYFKEKIAYPYAIRLKETFRKKICAVDAYIDEYVKLLEIERRAQIETQKREIRTMSAKERESYGRALTQMRAKKRGEMHALYLYRLGRDRPLSTQISTGDIVLVSKGEPLKSDLQATVTDVGRNFIDIAFTQRPPQWVVKERLRVDLYVNDIPFKRMRDNLEALRHPSESMRRLRDRLLFETYRDLPNRSEEHAPFVSKSLNAPQCNAVAEALHTDDLFLIHGPPGTGKTTTLVALIEEAVRRGDKVLATADSNVATDNLLYKLTLKGISVVRIGHPARVDTALLRHTLDRMLLSHPKYKEIEKLSQEIESLKTEQARYEKPTPGKTRGLSKSRIVSLAHKGKAMRGIDVATIDAMARWIAYEERIDALYTEMKRIESVCVEEILSGADVVCATNIMVGSEYLVDRFFDLVVIDEASQQIEPSTLLPALRGKRTVLAGDHRQLPPTVVSENDVLKRSLFERLMSRRDIGKQMLRIQYRMNRTVMDFPNRLMYDGKLIADKSVIDRVTPCRCDYPLLRNDADVYFCDIEESCEYLPQRSTSYTNEAEAEAVRISIEKALSGGLTSDDIAVITPYNAQIRLIKKHFEQNGIEGIEIGSVDGFQGREKEVVFLSTVRSNSVGAIGFVADKRRLNVAMTRARSKLVVFGNRHTLENDPTFKRLFAWFARTPRARIVSFSQIAY